MIDLLFRTRGQRERDIIELAELRRRHGTQVAAILKLEATDPRSDPRSRRRWKRLARLV